MRRDLGAARTSMAAGPDSPGALARQPGPGPRLEPGMNRDDDHPLLAQTDVDARSLLVLAARTGDDALGCGGLLALRRAAGARVATVVPAASPGATGLGYGEPLVAQILDALATVAPDLVLAPSPLEFDDDRHALSLACIEALRRSSGPLRLALYEIAEPGRPNLVVDITPVIDAKRSALAGAGGAEAVVEHLNRFRAGALPAGGEAAEAFELVTAADLACGRTALFASEYMRGAARGALADGRRDAPLVSVIVRSMDRVSLPAALDAVALQTYPNIELVLVNARGGRHRDPGVHCGRFPLRLVNQDGAPLSRPHAANVGLGAAGGEWMLFLDDDDTIDPDHVARLRLALAAEPGRQVAYAGVRLLQRSGAAAGVLDEPFDATRLWLANYLPIHAVLFARNLVDSGARFDEDLAVYEDWDFWRQLAERQTFLHVGGVSATYRLVGESGLSAQSDEAFARQARQRIYAKWQRHLDAPRIERIAAAAEVARGQAQDAAAHATAMAGELRAEQAQTAQLHGRLGAAEGALQEAQRSHDRVLGELSALSMAYADRVAALELAAADAMRTIAAHARVIAERDAQLAERDERITGLDVQIAERAARIADRDSRFEEAQRWQHELMSELAGAKAAYQELASGYQAVTGSWSWRITAPLRAVRSRLTRGVLRRGNAATAWWLIRSLPVSAQTRQRAKARLAASPLGVRLLRLLATPPATAAADPSTAPATMPPPLDKEAVRAAAEEELTHFLAGAERIVLASGTPPKVSVIVVLYNQAGLSLLCLRALAASRGAAFETIVVDNASSDRMPQLLQRLDGANVMHPGENLGFVRAVNAAAAHARGEYLLLLNNDAVVESDTLARAVARLDAEPRAGAVGGPILLWDGRLQEAGSIVWRDGSCLGYGRGDDPGAPPYRFLREVDYCSGALLMLRRELFERFGRFDDAYAPAYYEESDFCARLWEAGHTVVCDPKVRVKHFEFASDNGSGRAIALQAAHRTLFAARHSAFLAERPAPAVEAIVHARQRLPAGALRVLFVDDRVPFPWMGQGYPRAQRFVAALADAGHFVTHYPLQFPHEAWTEVEGVLPERVEVMLDHGLAGFAAFLAARAGYYDTIVVSRPHNMGVLQAVRGRQPLSFAGTTIVYDAEALFSVRDVAKARLRGQALDDEQARAMVAEELALSRGADHVVAVSEAEAAHYRAAGRSAVHVLGHALHAAPRSPSFDERSDFLFVGGIPDADTPNGDAVLWFVREVWPQVAAALGAEARLQIVGACDAPEVRALAGDSVHLHGRADDLAPIFDAARVFVVPTRYAAGIPHKAHEAAAHGLPMVATPLIADQLGWREELLVAGRAADFAAACLRLHGDAALWQALRDRALRAVERDCSPAAFDATVRGIVDAVAAARR